MSIKLICSVSNLIQTQFRTSPSKTTVKFVCLFTLDSLLILDKYMFFQPQNALTHVALFSFFCLVRVSRRIRWGAQWCTTSSENCPITLLIILSLFSFIISSYLSCLFSQNLLRTKTDFKKPFKIMLYLHS